MGWETRNGKGRYYTRTRRVNGKVVREYFGCGEEAEAAAAQDTARRLAEIEKRRRQTEADVVAMYVDLYCSQAEVLAQRCLYAAGYHRHNRGPWRKRRAKKEGAKPSHNPCPRGKRRPKARVRRRRSWTPPIPLRRKRCKSENVTQSVRKPSIPGSDTRTPLYPQRGRGAGGEGGVRAGWYSKLPRNVIEVLLTADPDPHTPTQPHAHNPFRIDERHRCRPEDLRRPNPIRPSTFPLRPSDRLPEKPKLTPEQQRQVLRSSPTFENLVQAIKSSVIQDRLDARAAARAAGLPEPPMEFPWDKKETPPTPKEEPEIAHAPVGPAAPLDLAPNPQNAPPSGIDIAPAAPDPVPSSSSFAVRPSHWIGSRPEDEATDEAIAAYEERQEWERKMEADYI